MLDSKSIGDESRTNGLGTERAGNPVDQPEVSGGSANKFLYTLPAKLKSLRGTPIEIAVAIADEPQPPELIELLGNALGIDDYKTNMAAFWFLDTLALQVLKRKTNLDENYLIVLVSWLAGEMMLIRERKLPREEFFRLMKELFRQAANKISEKNRCPYYDEIEWDKPGEIDADERKDDQEAAPEDLEQTSTKKTSRSTVDKSFSPNGKDEFEPFLSSVDPLVVLDILMESTYDMYANELRYELVYAVFVEQIEVQDYQLPFSIRKPRPAKTSTSATSPFNVELRRTFELHDVFKLVEKSTGKGKKKKNVILSMPSTPANSLLEEEVLVEKRRFILPLIEANEAMALFDQARENV